MRDERLAFLRRAAAPAAASIALHLALAAGATSIPLAAVLGFLALEEDPLLVEIVTEESRASSAPALRQAPRSTASRTSPAAPPPSRLPPAQERPMAAAMPGDGVSPPESPVGAPDDALAGTTERAISAEVPAAEMAAGSDGAVASGSFESGEVPSPAASAGVAAEPAADAQPDQRAARDGEWPPSLDLEAAPAPGEDALAFPRTPGEEPAVAAARGRLGEITRNASVSARAESEPFVGRRDVFEFLLDHPDFATHLTRALRLARYRVWRTDDGMFIDDGWGATGQLTVVHASSGSRVVYAKGEFQGKFLPTIPGEAVVTIDYDTWPTADGREMLHARISGQVKIEGALAALVLKVASSIAIEKAEKESRRLVAIMTRVLRAIDETPAAVYASLRERPDVPRVELEQFRTLLRLP
jgi:hypothetical protein